MKKTIIKNYDMESIIHEIALATVKPCPEITEHKIAIRKSDGFKFSPYGSIPWKSTIETDGYVYRDKNGCTFGKRFDSIHAATRKWYYGQLRQAVDFARYLRKQTFEEINRQAEYWNVDLPMDANRPGSIMNKLLKKD